MAYSIYGLVGLPSDQVVQFQALAGTFCCVLEQDILLSQCFFQPGVEIGIEKPNTGENPMMD